MVTSSGGSIMLCGCRTWLELMLMMELNTGVVAERPLEATQETDVTLFVFLFKKKKKKKKKYYTTFSPQSLSGQLNLEFSSKAVQRAFQSPII